MVSGFEAGANISPNQSRSGRYLAKSGLDLDDISSDLVDFMWISRSSLSKNFWISPDFVDFMVGSSGSGFWGGNPPANPKGSGPVGGDSSVTVKLIGSGGGWSVSGEFGGLSGSLSCVDTPNIYKQS